MRREMMEISSRSCAKEHVLILLVLMIVFVMLAIVDEFELAATPGMTIGKAACFWLGVERIYILFCRGEEGDDDVTDE